MLAMDGAKEIKLQSSFNKSEYDITTYGSVEIRSAFIFGAIYREDLWLVLGLPKGNWSIAQIAGE